MCVCMYTRVHLCICVYLCVCMRVHVCVEKCKAIENFPMPLILLSFEALHMVAVNIIATCVCWTGPLESLHKASS